MSDKILFIVNPVAGRLRSRTALFDMVNQFCKKDFSVNLAISQQRGHAKELASKAAENGFDMVVCCGGDGTLHEVINGLLMDGRKALPLGYIPAGSTNDFAETLGLSFFPAKAAERISKKQGMKIDIGQFNENRYFSYIASFGAFSAASYDATQEMKNAFGRFAYILEGIKDLGEIRSHRVNVLADGESYSGNYIFCAVSNTSSIGGMVKLKASLFNINDGLFEVILVKKPQNAMDLNLILASIASSDFDNHMFDFFKAGDIKFTLSRSINWSLDGEKADGRGEVHIKVLKSAITLCK